MTDSPSRAERGTLDEEADLLRLILQIVPHDDAGQRAVSLRRGHDLDDHTNRLVPLQALEDSEPCHCTQALRVRSVTDAFHRHDDVELDVFFEQDLLAFGVRGLVTRHDDLLWFMGD